ncbi:outer membrane protein [Methylobacterium gnaphalii]|uniref:Outer membrane protein OmpA-like transmembrane domain-containing protein n=1 Tax=Methylobacterium gnaphalii TaxID=1010610 RepID=A0A512JLG2_9HYPH|nr:hypothetical protein [Methylobacterium gnaphalii]GEP10799.1 hypothetical protein MGN01_26440 [Methylobacterium gnaphalii]GJD71323.1 hypothetical protein MMMDOFMJ_4279 [Methylobacterium gnaphalii]GLS49338.1 hypothetical protein GCM10007885_21860 [Methylobacterium gnaphalii]
MSHRQGVALEAAFVRRRTQAPRETSRQPRLSLSIGMGYLGRMSLLRHTRRLGRWAACLVAGSVVASAGPAAAQAFSPFIGFASLPSFAWPQPESIDEGRWAGSYASLSAGYQVSSSKHFGSYSGPTVGFEGGRMWQEGRFVYGIVGGFDYLSAIGGNATPGFGRLAYSRDFAGALQLKVGALLTPDVLVYGKLGALAVHEQWRVGPTSVSQPFSRDDIAIRPDARVGVEWAVTDKLTLAVEAGMTGSGIR